MGIYWTIQTMEKWQLAKNLGFLIGHREHIWPDFSEPYHWMMRQMAERLPNYQGEYPVWVWTERPDLRRMGHLEKGTRGVLLKIDIEDTRILCSEFQAWHFVLMDCYCDIEAKEDFELDLSRQAIEESWKTIFDLNYLAEHPDWGECTVQGVTGKVMLHEISLVKEFTAR